MLKFLQKEIKLMQGGGREGKRSDLVQWKASMKSEYFEGIWGIPQRVEISGKNREILKNRRIFGNFEKSEIFWGIEKSENFEKSEKFWEIREILEIGEFSENRGNRKRPRGAFASDHAVLVEDLYL